MSPVYDEQRALDDEQYARELPALSEDPRFTEEQRRKDAQAAAVIATGARRWRQRSRG